MAGRPRTADAILELRGSFEKDPQRRRETAIPKAGIGPCPPEQVMSRSEAWDFLVSISIPGVLGDRDRATLRIAADLFALYTRVGVEEMEAAKLNRLDTMLGKLGLNPSDASRVGGTGKKPPQNPFEEV